MTKANNPKPTHIAFKAFPDWSGLRINELVCGGGKIRAELEAEYSEERKDKLIVSFGPSEPDATMCTTRLSMTMVTKEDADAVIDFFSAMLEMVSASRDRLVKKTEEAEAYAKFKAQRETVTADSSQEDEKPV